MILVGSCPVKVQKMWIWARPWTAKPKTNCGFKKLCLTLWFCCFRKVSLIAFDVGIVGWGLAVDEKLASGSTRPSLQAIPALKILALSYCLAYFCFLGLGASRSRIPTCDHRALLMKIQRLGSKSGFPIKCYLSIFLALSC